MECIVMYLIIGLMISLGSYLEELNVLKEEATYSTLFFRMILWPLFVGISCIRDDHKHYSNDD